MNKSAVYILNLEDLYNIIFEIKNFLNFDLLKFQDEKSLIEDQKNRGIKSFIVVAQEKINNDLINDNQIITIEKYPLNFLRLIEKIHTNLLMQQYDYQSNITISNYKLNINSKVISSKGQNLKLTERETHIILFLKKQKQPININILQKEVWGYSEDLETHTVETHIYRLRKKFKNFFNDDAFIKSDKKGYFIQWKKKILLQKTWWHLNIKQELLSQKKGREVLKEKKNN